MSKEQKKFNSRKNAVSYQHVHKYIYTQKCRKKINKKFATHKKKYYFQTAASWLFSTQIQGNNLNRGLRSIVTVPQVQAEKTMQENINHINQKCCHFDICCHFLKNIQLCKLALAARTKLYILIFWFQIFNCKKFQLLQIPQLVHSTYGNISYIMCCDNQIIKYKFQPIQVSQLAHITCGNISQIMCCDNQITKILSSINL
eukprot:TRINITY_DN4626_c0_g2_i1.p4 TRINITY_DN4626_c0_g2~~TRINITY_DN4626_c0_g2_i1.p4  ORF type:complete len:201 (+),score=-9.06 TRINITY_DN4626_c0_g2_i1:660-1262(+)